MKNLHLFFATKNDLLPNIDKLESNLDIYYVLSGIFDKKQTYKYQSLVDIDEIGTATAKTLSLCNSYLVIPKNVKIRNRWVFQRRGGIKFAYDQENNPKSIVIRPGGVYQDKFLLAGAVSTLGETKESTDLFNKFSKLLTNGFEKIKDFYLGPESLIMLNEGKRLVTISIDSPVEYDLSLE
jgi:hypothetical protein